MSRNLIVQHKRSQVSGNKPTTSQVSVGELAINFPDKSLYTQTSGGSIIELSRDIYRSTSAPTTPTVGQVWYDTNNSSYKFWDGSSWVSVTSAGKPLLPANLSSTKGFSGGSGTSGSPYTYASSISVPRGSTGYLIDTFTLSGLTSSQIISAVDALASSNGGRFYLTPISVGSTGSTTFCLFFSDSPSSASGTSFSSTINLSNSIYISCTVTIASVIPQVVNIPENTALNSTLWTSAADTLTSGGSLLISLDGVNFSTGPLSVTPGALVYTKWVGDPGSGIGIDSAHGTTITGTITGSSGASQTSSLTVDKQPDSFTFVDQTGVAPSSSIESNSILVSGINSYAYVTSSGVGDISVDGGSFDPIPSSATLPVYVSSGQSFVVRQTSSSSSLTATNLPVSVGGVSDTFTVTTAAGSSVNTPTITSPVAASSVSSKSTITSSAYSISGTPGSHLNTDWEIYSDSALTTLVTSSMADSTNLTRWTPSGLSNSTSYWVRVKHRSSSLVESSWSPAVQFTTIGLFIAVAHNLSPFISVYPWTGSFGAKVANPSTLPAGNGTEVAFSPSGSHIAISHGNSPFISVYLWTGSFGAKVANPSTLPAGNGNGVAFSPSGSHIALAHDSSPYLSVYPWTGAFGAKVADPATLPTGAGTGVAFSPSGSHIAVSHFTTPYISVYPWTGAFGAKVADPATLPTGTGFFDVAFSPSGSHIALAHDSSPYLSVYPWTGSFGAKVANPATLPPNNCYSVAFSNSGSHLAVAHSTTPFISVYNWTGTFGTRVSDPSTLPTGVGNGVAFSPSDSHIAVAHAASPYVSVYPWTGSFGAKRTNPSTLPPNTGRWVAFSPA